MDFLKVILGTSETLGPDYRIHDEVLTNLFFMIKKFFFQNEYIFSGSKNIFQMRYLFFSFSVKKAFSVNKKKLFFFNLVLQQMNNHNRAVTQSFCSP